MPRKQPRFYSPTHRPGDEGVKLLVICDKCATLYIRLNANGTTRFEVHDRVYGREIRRSPSDWKPLPSVRDRRPKVDKPSKSK